MAALGALIGLTGASAAQAANLTGTNVGVAWLYPNTATVFASQSFLVGPGAELTCPGLGAGGGLCTGFTDSSVIDLGSNTLSLTITGGTSAWSPAAFNGYEFSGLAAGAPWTGYTLATTFSGFDASRITFTPDVVRVNMQGIGPVAGQSFTISLTSGAVPEPATWAMMILGLGAAGSLLRRRRMAIA